MADITVAPAVARSRFDRWSTDWRRPGQLRRGSQRVDDRSGVRRCSRMIVGVRIVILEVAFRSRNRPSKLSNEVFLLDKIVKLTSCRGPTQPYSTWRHSAPLTHCDFTEFDVPDYREVIPEAFELVEKASSPNRIFASSRSQRRHAAHAQQSGLLQGYRGRASGCR